MPNIQPSLRFRALLVTFAAIAIVIAVWMPTFRALAVGCTGDACTGLNPETMGCGADAATGPNKAIPGGWAQNRYSIACDAEWERTRNQSGASKYAAGSIRYGCANYCYAQSVSSPNKIASGLNVYTPMKGPDGITPTRSCGRLADTGPIGVPLALSDTYCGGVA